MGQKNFLGPKEILRLKKFFGPKNVLGLKNYLLAKKISGIKYDLVENHLFGQKVFLGPKLFLSLSNVKKLQWVGFEIIENRVKYRALHNRVKV